MRQDERQPGRWKTALGVIVLAVVLALAFCAYLRPGFVLDIANRIIMCF